MTEFKGTRAAFAASLIDLAKENDKVMFVSPDSLKAMRATDFADQYPEQFVEVGISEQNAVNVGAGLASTGILPFVATYAGFLTMRGCEQMRTFVAYPNLNVKFVGINAGLIGGEREGVTHQFYEDLGILSNIPNFTIFSPADGPQTYKACMEAAKIDGPVYIRAGSGRENDIYSVEDGFSLDGITVLKEYGDDVLLVSTGYVLERVLDAAEILKSKGINATVADVNILFGKDPSKIVEVIKKAKKIVTVEDHNINGGLGSYISNLAGEYCPVKISKIGLNSFGESGPAKELADHYGFSPENISNVAMSD